MESKKKIIFQRRSKIQMLTYSHDKNSKVFHRVCLLCDKINQMGKMAEHFRLGLCCVMKRCLKFECRERYEAFCLRCNFFSNDFLEVLNHCILTHDIEVNCSVCERIINIKDLKIHKHNHLFELQNSPFGFECSCGLF